MKVTLQHQQILDVTVPIADNQAAVLCSERPTLLPPASAAHASSLELRDLLGHLLCLFRWHRLIDDTKELLLVLVDEGEEVRVLLAQLLHQPSQRLQSQCALIDMCYA